MVQQERKRRRIDQVVDPVVHAMALRGGAAVDITKEDQLVWKAVVAHGQKYVQTNCWYSCMPKPGMGLQRVRDRCGGEAQIPREAHLDGGVADEAIPAWRGELGTWAQKKKNKTCSEARLCECETD